MDWSGEKRDGAFCQLVPELDKQLRKKDLDILLKSKLVISEQYYFNIIVTSTNYTRLEGLPDVVRYSKPHPRY